MDFVIAIPDALVAAYEAAIVRRNGRIPASALPPLSATVLRTWLIDFLRGHARTELFDRAALGEDVDAELRTLARIVP